MKKDFTRDYATEAFRLYAAMGKPSYEEATKQIYEAALNDCEFKDPEIANISAEAAVNNATPLLLDILAVEKTIDILERGNKTHIARAISDVYFVQPEQPLRRGDITARVRRYSLTAFSSERNVYLWLKEARLLFAAVRGLRIAEADAHKYKVCSSSVL